MVYIRTVTCSQRRYKRNYDVYRIVMPNKMIEMTTGNIKVASGKVINPFMSFEEVNRLGIGESQAERDMGNGWVWHDVTNVRSGAHKFNMSFAFNGGKLSMATVVLNNSKPSFNGWESWSEKEELQNDIILNN